MYFNQIILSSFELVRPRSCSSTVSPILSLSCILPAMFCLPMHPVDSTGMTRLTFSHLLVMALLTSRVSAAKPGERHEPTSSAGSGLFPSPQTTDASSSVMPKCPPASGHEDDEQRDIDSSGNCTSEGPEKPAGSGEPDVTRGTNSPATSVSFATYKGSQGTKRDRPDVITAPVRTVLPSTGTKTEAKVEVDSASSKQYAAEGTASTKTEAKVEVDSASSKQYAAEGTAKISFHVSHSILVGGGIAAVCIIVYCVFMVVALRKVLASRRQKIQLIPNASIGMPNSQMPPLPAVPETSPRQSSCSTTGNSMDSGECYAEIGQDQFWTGSLPLQGTGVEQHSVEKKMHYVHDYSVRDSNAASSADTGDCSLECSEYDVYV